MERYLKSFILEDLNKKIVLLAGPRQTGKTTLARSLFPVSQEYLNFDSGPDRDILRKQHWRKDVDLLILDELHKMRNWKRWLKGVYDTQGVRPRLLVTGSARMDTYRKAGDSLAGRFFHFRLHPVSVAEASRVPGAEASVKILDRILRLGGFPEPFLSDSETSARRWRASHLDRILREDLLDLEKVREIKLIEILVDLLSQRVGGSVSYSSLARDLEVSPHTVKKWVEILERLFVVFVVTPYSRQLARTLLKEPKIFFYDTGRVRGDEGARFENLVATHLLKRNHFLEDTQGLKMALHYVKDHQKREVDFLVTRDASPDMLIEAKAGDESFSKPLIHYSGFFESAQAIQLVRDTASHPVRPRQSGPVRLLPASEWLAGLEA